MATWRSGYAAVCKTVYPGSIPGVASSLRSRLASESAAIAGAHAYPDFVAVMLLKPPRLCYRHFHFASTALFPGSSVVEQPAVNRLVAGSNPARGAKFFSNFASQLRSARTRW